MGMKKTSMNNVLWELKKTRPVTGNALWENKKPHKMSNQQCIMGMKKQVKKQLTGINHINIKWHCIMGKEKNHETSNALWE
jgi:hypothetical protein